MAGLLPLQDGANLDFSDLYIKPTFQKKPLVVRTEPSLNFSHIAFSPNGKLIAAGAYDGSVTVWDSNNLKRKYLFQNKERSALSHITSLAFSPNGKKLLVAINFDEKIRIWDLTNGKASLITLGPGLGYLVAKYSLDSKTLAVISRELISLSNRKSSNLVFLNPPYKSFSQQIK